VKTFPPFIVNQFSFQRPSADCMETDVATFYAGHQMSVPMWKEYFIKDVRFNSREFSSSSERTITELIRKQ